MKNLFTLFVFSPSPTQKPVSRVMDIDEYHWFVFIEWMTKEFVDYLEHVSVKNIVRFKEEFFYPKSTKPRFCEPVTKIFAKNVDAAKVFESNYINIVSFSIWIPNNSTVPRNDLVIFGDVFEEILGSVIRKLKQ